MVLVESQQVVLAQATVEARKAEADRLYQQGLQQFRANQFSDAFQTLQAALQIYREIQDRSNEALVLLGLGRISEDLSQYPQALEFYQQALTAYQDVGDRRGEGTTLNNIGLVYKSRGEYPQALEQYQLALAILRDVGDCNCESSTLNGIGSVYRALGQYPEALEQYQQALAINRDVGDRSGEGATLNNIGLVYKSLGQYPQALEQFQQALAISREVGDRRGEGATLNSIGSVYDLQEQYPQALEQYQQALAISREVDNRSGEGAILNNIGAVYNYLGQYPQALEQLQQALVIAREVGNRSGEGIILHNIGFAYDALGQYAQALEQLQQALAISRDIGEREGAAITFSNIGELLEKQNQPELAIVFLKQSVNTFELIRQDLKVLSNKQQQSYTETVADTYRKLADLLLSQDRILEAQRVLDLLKVQELEDYFKDVRGNVETAQGIPSRDAETQIETPLNQILDNAIQLGKELTQLSQIPIDQRSPQQQERIKQLRQQQQRLTQDYLNFLNSDRVKNIIAQLRQNTGGQSIDLENITALQDNLRNLQQGAVLLYPFVLDDRLELVLVTPDAPPIRRTVTIQRADLNRQIIALRDALKNPHSDAVTPAKALYESLIKPIENDLKQANAKTIIYAPDGALRYIPLAALHDGSGWLAQRFRVNNITAVSLTDLNTQPQRNPAVFIGAFTEGSYPVTVNDRQQTFAGLEFAGREAENLADLIPNHIQHLNQAFAPDTVLEMNDYTIVHLATHAAFVPTSPDESFILFGNGKPVTLRDVKTWTLSNVDLVVLSACETGLGDELGDGREILGLGFQIQRTGARAALASLWQVSDGGTQALMDAFYAALKSGMTKAEALQAAQTALITGNFSTIPGTRSDILVTSTETGRSIDNNPLDHPYYWAPFILIGNGL